MCLQHAPTQCREQVLNDAQPCAYLQVLISEFATQSLLLAENALSSLPQPHHTTQLPLSLAFDCPLPCGMHKCDCATIVVL